MQCFCLHSHSWFDCFYANVEQVWQAVLLRHVRQFATLQMPIAGSWSVDSDPCSLVTVSRNEYCSAESCGRAAVNVRVCGLNDAHDGRGAPASVSW